VWPLDHSHCVLTRSPSLLTPPRCSKFQPVAQFDASKRSCAASLASHNARRRRDDTQGSRKSPPSGPSPTREVAREDTASALHGHVEGDGSAVPRLGGVGCPALEAFINGSVLDMADWLNAQDAYPVVSSAASPADSARQPSAASAAAEAMAVDAYTLHLKLGNAHAVEDVPLDSLLPELELQLPGLGPMSVASRYGCVLLSFDGLAPAAAAPGARTASPQVLADALAKVLRARKLGALVPGSSVLLFSDARPAPAGAPLLVTADDAAAAAAAGHPPAAWLPLAAGWLGRVPAPLQGLVPGAVLLQPTPDGGATVMLELGAALGVRAEGDGGVEVATSVHARAQGLTLAQEVRSTQLRVTLPAGVASQECLTLLLEAQEERRWPGGGAPSTSLSRPLAILACRDAAVAAQVAATCAFLAQAGIGAAARRERASMDAVLRACGDAFCPDAPLAVCVASAKACLVLGWDALLLALLQAQHLSPVSRGALVLAGMAHMRTGRPVSGPCASVVHACALQLWPDSAPAAAASLLVASEREGISIPELATETALVAASAQEDDGGAAQVLRSLELLLQQGQSSPWHQAHVAAAAGRGEESEALELGPATAREAFYLAGATTNVPTARIYLLFVLSLDVFGHVRRLALRRAGPLLPGELATMTRVLTTEETMRAYFYYDAWTFMPNTLALLLLLLPPAASRARRFYLRNATALFSAHCFLTYILNHVLFELYWRRWLAVPAAAGLLPRWWSAGQLNITASAAIAPMPAAPLCVLLALRAALMFTPAAWSLWPQGQPLLGGGRWWALSQARANAVLTLLLCARLLRNERRHFASWRHTRAVRAAKDA
jgi:hypothetical protein